MGIQQTKSLLKTYYTKQNPKDTDNYLQKAFCPEVLQINELLENFWDVGASEHFDWTNITEGKKLDECQKEKERFYLKEKYIIPELPLNPTIVDNLFSIESKLFFNHLALCEYKEAYSSGEIKYFSNAFIKRMHILLIVFVKRIIEVSDENSPVECIAKYFESLKEENAPNAGLESALPIFIKLLDEVSTNNIKLKEETLDFLVANTKFIRPLAFWGETKRYFVLDKSLNEVVNYLKKIISDKKENPSFRFKSFKILFNLGLAKGSLKNLLEFVELYKEIDERIDLVRIVSFILT